MRSKTARMRQAGILLGSICIISLMIFFIVKWRIQTYAADEITLKVNGEAVSGSYEMTDSKVMLSVDGIQGGQTVTWQIVDDTTIENIDISNSRDNASFLDSTFEVTNTNCYVKAAKFGTAKVLVKVLDTDGQTPVFDSAVTININFHISKSEVTGSNVFRKPTKQAEKTALILKESNTLHVNVGKACDYKWRVTDENVAKVSVADGNETALIEPVGTGKTTVTAEGNGVEDTLDIYVLSNVLEEGNTTGAKNIVVKNGKNTLQTNAKFTANSTELIYDKMAWAIYQLNADGRSYTLIEDSVLSKQSDLVELQTVSTEHKDQLNLYAKAGKYVVKFWPKGMYKGEESEEELEYIDEFADKMTIDARVISDAKDVTLCVNDDFDLAEAMNLDTDTFNANYTIKIYEKEDTDESNPPYISTPSHGKFSALKATNSTYVRIEAVPKASCTLQDANGVSTTAVFRFRIIDNFLLNGSNVSMVSGGTMQLLVSTGNNTGELTWESSNEEYVTVDEVGLLKAIKSTSDLPDGSVTITVSMKLSDGSTRKATCKVIVDDTVQNIQLNKSDVTLLEGTTTNIRASFTPDRIEAPLKWISSDESVFTLNVAGDSKSAEINAVKSGTAVLTVMNKDDYVTAVCKITVVAPMEKISLESESMTVRLSQEFIRMNATYTPASAANNTLIWKSSNEDVATVDSTGLVNLHKAGTTYITVRPTYDTIGDVRAECLLTVEQSATGISFAEKSVSVEKGSNVALTYHLQPDDKAKTDVTWKSMDEQVVKVDAKGNVTGVNVGGTYVIVTTSEGDTDICSVIVTQKATGITMTEDKIIVGTEASKQIGYSLTPADATSIVTWHSFNTEVAMVDANGVVTGVNPGKTTILASVEGIMASCEVEVRKSATGIALAEKEIALQMGTQKTLTCEPTPSDAYVSLQWSSMNDAVATVDVNGVVTAVDKGETYIMVTSAEGYSDYCKVVVTKQATGVNLVDQEISIVKDAAHQVSYTVTPEDATANVTWASMDESIATIDQNGIIKAIAVGTTTISMTNVDNGQAQYCTVHVLDVSTGITLAAEEITVAKGATQKINYTLTPEDSTTTLTWLSINTAVATVDEEGNVLGVAVGETYVTVTSVDGYSATCKVIVTQASEGITLGNTNLTLGVGDTYQVPVTLTPADATDQTVSWYSKNPEIATVSADGKVTGVAVGETIIIASIPNGQVAYLNVTVHSILTGITLDKSNETLYVGQILKIGVVYAPTDATNQLVKWTSSNDAVATVSEDGTVTAVAGGIAIVTCTSDSGGYTATCIINVTEMVTSVKLNKSSCRLAVNKSITLKATVENASASNTKIKWSTSNKKIATVTSSGKVTAKKIGSCTIKAKATDGSGAYATCKITVVKKIKKLMLNHAYLKVAEGDTAKLKAKVKPKGASNKSLAWSSADTSIAVVDSNGKINAIAAGMTEISVETTDGTKLKATCILQVVEKNPVTSITASASDIIMVAGTSQSASVVISPSNTTDKIKYQSDAKSIASVTSTGKIKAKRPGYATITVTSTSNVQVCINVNVVGLNKTSLSLEQYDSDSLWVEEISDTVKWSSSDPSIARVENGNVVGRKVGTCTITASVKGVKLHCKVRVKKIHKSSKD